MTDLPQARLAQTIQEAEDALQSRWPESKLEPRPADPEYVLTVYGVGYRFCDD